MHRSVESASFRSIRWSVLGVRLAIFRPVHCARGLHEAATYLSSGAKNPFSTPLLPGAALATPSGAGVTRRDDSKGRVRRARVGVFMSALTGLAALASRIGLKPL